jgi:hypothetical protein
MPEQEIIKHATKAYKVFKSPDMSMKSKITDILTEIAIIVFAVSISIWLSNWSEKRHDRKEEKEFLAGFKKDLKSEIENMTSSRDFYTKTIHGIEYFLSIQKGIALNRDSINKFSFIFFSSTDLDPHVSRYEGLKSSGKFKIIENKELLNNIIDLQETIIQRIQNLNEKYYQHNQMLENLINQNVQLAKNGNITNAAAVVSRSDMIILLNTSQSLIEFNIIGIHDKGIKKCTEIIGQIDEELK